MCVFIHLNIWTSKYTNVRYDWNSPAYHFAKRLETKYLYNSRYIVIVYARNADFRIQACFENQF